MTTAKQLTPPANLDPTKRHNPEEYEAWQDAWDGYRAALASREQAESLKAAAQDDEANRDLTPTEYRQLAERRYEDMQRRIAEREAASKAQADAEREYMASIPEIAEITEASDFLLLIKLQHWFSLGYEVHNDSIQFFAPGCYSVSLRKKTTAKKGK